MPIPKYHRFPVEFTVAFPQGLLLLGDISPATEYQPDRTRVPAQQMDPDTGLPVWAATVTDPAETNSRRASFNLLLLAPSQPEPVTPEIVQGVRPFVVDGLTAEPRVMGQGEFRFLGYTYRATTIKPATPPPAPAGKPPAGRKTD